MTATLVYWISVAALGFLAAAGSSITGWSYYRGLRQHYPIQAATYWPETVRDQLLVLGLGFNLLTGVLALHPIWRTSPLTLLAVLGGATCMSLFAIFNFILRTGR